MSQNTLKPLNQMLSAECMNEIDSWIAKYPADQKQSAVMAALRVAQEAHCFLTPELMDAVAVYLDMPAVAVYEVATFYTMYELRPVGRHVVNICTNISCKLRHSAEIVDAMEERLGVKLGETTADGRFTLRSVECLGACVNAPAIQVDKDYHENLTREKIDQILEQYE